MKSETPFSDLWVREALGNFRAVPERKPERSGAAAPAFARVVSDTRKIREGDLFVALVGEKHDAHAFIPQAYAAGALAVIACPERAPDLVVPAGKMAYLVPDTLEAYRKLGAARRRDFAGPVVGVGGSVGKTTTKELLAAMLSSALAPVHKTEGSQNGFVGIPMTLLELPPDARSAVIEIGIDEIGAMMRHCLTVKPDVAVLTPIAEEHLFQLRDIETVAREETALLRDTHSRGGKIVACWDDPWARPELERLGAANQVGLSLDPGFPFPSGVHGLWGEWDAPTLTLRVRDTRGGRFELTSPLPGRHNALNLLTAAGACVALGLDPAAMARGLASFRTAFGRTELRTHGASGAQLLCDYYNASPASMRAALELLRESATPAGRAVAVLGDMLELGPDEERLHRELAPILRSLSITDVYLYGERMRWLADALARDGRSAPHFASHEDLARALVPSLKTGDWVLLKGSRGMRMERVAEALGLGK